MKWGVICKPNAKRAISLSADVCEILQENGEIYPDENVAQLLNLKGYTLKEINEKCDIAVTIGGDGTILMALEYIEKPIFAINSGAMGFLTEVESKYTKAGLQQLIDGKYNIEERSKLKIIVDGKRLSDAANEVTIQTAKIAKILYLQIFVEDDLIETMGADGIIISTPTGSTSYSLSVGGPLMDPAVNAMIIAPLAAFKLSARPWIVPLDKTVRVKLLPKSKETKLVIDGQRATTVTPENDIKITVSEKKAKFVRFGETFYQMVRLKLAR